MVPPLPTTSWQHTPGRISQSCDVLERYANYHPIIVKNCRSCQINKRRTLKYGKLPAKNAITTPFVALCVDCIGPYTLRGKDGTEIDFMCLTMIDPASSWFEIAELPVVEHSTSPTEGNKRAKTHNQKEKEAYFDKSSASIGSLLYQTWFSRYMSDRVY